MQIELLHINECPSWGKALKNLRHALIDLDIADDVEVRLLESDQSQYFGRFNGSPTITVDGKDIFGVDDYDGELSCRVYWTPQGLRGYPTQEQIFDRLREIQAQA